MLFDSTLTGETEITRRKAHQSKAKPASRKNLSTVVLLKSRGQDGTFHKGFTSSCSSISSCDRGALLPILKTTLRKTEKISQTYKNSMKYFSTTIFEFWNFQSCLKVPKGESKFWGFQTTLKVPNLKICWLKKNCKQYLTVRQVQEFQKLTMTLRFVRWLISTE